MNGDGTVEIFGRDHSGGLQLYSADGQGGWGAQAFMGGGWNDFQDVAGLGSYAHQKYNNLAAVNGNGDLVLYSTGAMTTGLYGPQGPVAAAGTCSANFSSTG